jgi:hypothetical protein
MNTKNSNKHGFVAGMAVCAGLLLNDLVIFGNLNLNTASIVMLTVVGVTCLFGYVIVSKKESNK